jgi:hypothetical protein
MFSKGFLRCIRRLSLSLAIVDLSKPCADRLRIVMDAKCGTGTQGGDRESEYRAYQDSGYACGDTRGRFPFAYGAVFYA